MALESGTYLNDLNITFPTNSETLSEGDDHLRLIKKTIKNSFPGFTGTVIAGGTSTNSSNAYSLAAAIPAYITNTIVIWIPNATNTGASTMNINGLGAINIFQSHGIAVVANDIQANQPLAMLYDGTQFRIIGTTKNYTDLMAFSTNLPSQTGNAGKVLQSDGTNANWQNISTSQSTFNWCGTAGGTANALTLTPVLTISSYLTGAQFNFKAGASPNSGATTVNINGLGAIAVQMNLNALTGGEIEANQLYTLTLNSATTAQLTKIGTKQTFQSGGISIAAGGLTVVGTTGITGGSLNLAKGNDIAAAATTDISAAGNYVIVTNAGGATSITGLGTVAAGAQRDVKFSISGGSITLTHNATSLILPGGNNISVINGDCATFISLGSGNWQCTAYQSNTIYPLLWNITGKSATYTVTSTTDRNAFFYYTASSNVILNLPTVASAGNGFMFAVRNDNTNSATITITPNGAELIEGGSTLVIGVGGSMTFICDGTKWSRIESGSSYTVPSFVIGSQVFTSSGTFTVPAGIFYIRVTQWGAGGGGGGGGSASGTSSIGGSGGSGGSGAFATGIFSVVPGQSYTVTVGVGGTPGTGGVAANGTSGGNGGTTSFGALLTTTGGNGGTYGALATGNGSIGAAGTAGTGGTASGAGTLINGASAGTTAAAVSNTSVGASGGSAVSGGISGGSQAGGNATGATAGVGRTGSNGAALNTSTTGTTRDSGGSSNGATTTSGTNGVAGGNGGGPGAGAAAGCGGYDSSGTTKTGGNGGTGGNGKCIVEW